MIKSESRRQQRGGEGRRERGVGNGEWGAGSGEWGRYLRTNIRMATIANALMAVDVVCNYMARYAGCDGSDRPNYKEMSTSLLHFCTLSTSLQSPSSHASLLSLAYRFQCTVAHKDR